MAVWGKCLNKLWRSSVSYAGFPVLLQLRQWRIKVFDLSGFLLPHPLKRSIRPHTVISCPLINLASTGRKILNQPTVIKTNNLRAPMHGVCPRHTERAGELFTQHGLIDGAGRTCLMIQTHTIQGAPLTIAAQLLIGQQHVCVKMRITGSTGAVFIAHTRERFDAINDHRRAIMIISTTGIARVLRQIRQRSRHRAVVC